ncbi:MAG: Protease synthase and sporulation protein PAI 2 [Anaerolineales bacterium]|nr:Protease synthase and sporulation protein PAI 2 [Anaerolineales bacterium]
MHIPKNYREDDLQKILAFLRANEFATLVVCDGGKPVASHLLMEVAEQDGNIVVYSHMSRSNPLWKRLDPQREALVMFLGPHAYISATWYNHVNVPTWNYISVHAYGRPELITDHDQVYALLSRLVMRHEGATDYRMESLPQDFVEREMKGVAAFKIKLTRLEAAYKLSQNRNDDDYRNIIIELERRDDDLSAGVAAAMRQNRAVEAR